MSKSKMIQGAVCTSKRHRAEGTWQNWSTILLSIHSSVISPENNNSFFVTLEFALYCYNGGEHSATESSMFLQQREPVFSSVNSVLAWI